MNYICWNYWNWREEENDPQINVKSREQLKSFILSQISPLKEAQQKESNIFYFYFSFSCKATLQHFTIFFTFFFMIQQFVWVCFLRCHPLKKPSPLQLNWSLEIRWKSVEMLKCVAMVQCWNVLICLNVLNTSERWSHSFFTVYL